MRTPTFFGFSTLFLLCTTSESVGQTILQSIPGAAAGDTFGAAVGEIGDVDLDGFEDVLVGAPTASVTAPQSGTVSVYSGKDGSLLLQRHGGQAGDRFGTSVAGVGDANQDGIADFAAGTPGADGTVPNSGGATVVSGADGSTIHQWFGDLTGDRFGWSVVRLGDVDQDGTDDAAVGAPFWQTETGFVRAFSGGTGAVIQTVTGFGVARFGWDVAAPGDLSGDGVPDLVTGAPTQQRVSAHALPTGVLLWTYLNGAGAFGSQVESVGDVTHDGFSDVAVGSPDEGTMMLMNGRWGVKMQVFGGTQAGDRFGEAVASIGDVDGDGVPDFAVGAPNTGPGASASGYVRIFSGRFGVAIDSIESAVLGDRFGAAIAAVGFANHDTLGDFVIGAPTAASSAGEVSVIAGDCEHWIVGEAPSPALYRYEGAPGVSLGYDVARAGDVNGDGLADFIIGAPTNFSLPPGTAEVRSGQDGTLIHLLSPGGAQWSFGQAVDSPGDVNGDGVADLVVGEPLANSIGFQRGYVYLISGSNGQTLIRVAGDSDQDALGGSIGAAGDVNNDGIVDYIAGASADDTGGFFNNGSAIVYSGANSSILWIHSGLASSDFAGASVGGAGDVDLDGHDDVIVGISGNDLAGFNAGMARVYSGLDGSVLHQVTGANPFGLFGSAVDGAGDVNADGVPDFIVGAPQDGAVGVQWSGLARVYSGTNGALLHSFAGDDLFGMFGSSVSGASDVDGDGFDDVVVGAAWDDSRTILGGAVRIFSGQTGARLEEFVGANHDGVGRTVDGLGDVNGDGRPDVVAGGLPWPLAAPGVASIYSSICSQVQNYGAGCPGRNGLPPKLTLIGCPTAGQTVHVSLSGASGPTAILVLGSGKGSIPIECDCTLLVQPLFPGAFVVPLGPSGSLDVAATVPMPPAPATITMQAFVLDPGTHAGFAATNGVEMKVQ